MSNRPKLGIEIALEEWVNTKSDKEKKRLLVLPIKDLCIKFCEERKDKYETGPGLTDYIQKLRNGELNELETSDYYDNVKYSMMDFICGNKRIFKIANEFGFHLNKTDLDISCDCIPSSKSTTYWIELPQPWKAQDGTYFHSAIVCVTTKEQFLNNISPKAIGSRLKWDVHGLLQIVGRKFDSFGNALIAAKNFTVILEAGKLLNEVVMDADGEKTDLDFFSFIVKCILYIESGEPDLVRETGNPPQSHDIKKRKRHLENNCPFDVVRVGYGFHQPTYHVDEWGVCGHFRWQPYGEKRSKVKLIWIDPQTRKRHDLIG